MQRVLFNFYLALDGVMDNRLRAVLTALGIVFGVAAVIAMLAIGTGAKIEILERMKLIGTNNIEITALEKLPEATEEEGDDGDNSSNAGTIRDDDSKKPYSPGLTLKDARAIMKVIPTVENVSPEVVMPVTVIQSGLLKKANCVGVTNAFFEFNNLFLEGGNYFHAKHFEEGRPVCVIGNNVKTKFFSKKEPIGEQIKCGENWLTIIGVLGKRKASRKNLEELGIRDYNADIYIPIETALLRFENRGAITAQKVNSRRRNNDDKDENYHQLDRLVVRVDNSDDLIATAGVVGRMLKRRHRDLRDFEVEVPELLLEQQQKTQNTFNVVLAVIAGISLLVGGIGIMNIMLATVLERIKEIGVRRSLGATRQDIVLQFLFESVFMSLIGGLIGIILGVAAAELIAGYAEIPTIVSTWSIVLSFGVAASVGLVFGIIPARRAAFLDPIKALRND